MDEERRRKRVCRLKREESHIEGVSHDNGVAHSDVNIEEDGANLKEETMKDTTLDKQDDVKSDEFDGDAYILSLDPNEIDYIPKEIRDSL